MAMPAAWAAIIVAANRGGRPSPPRAMTGARSAPAAFLDAAGRRGGQPLLLLIADADGEAAAQDGDGGRRGAGGADIGFHAQRSIQALRVGQAMGEDIGLQGDDGAALREGGSDFLIENAGRCDSSWSFAFCQVIWPIRIQTDAMS